MTKNSVIDWIQLLLIGMTAPFFFFPSMKYIWIFSVVPGIWICRWIVKNHFFERTVLDWAIAILFIHVLITCIIVPDLELSLPKIAGVLFGLAFFYSIVSLIKSEKLIKQGIIFFISAGFLLSLISILDMRWSAEIYLDEIVLKIEKIMPKMKWNLPGAEEGINSTALGGILILIVPLSLVIFVSYLKRKKELYLIPNRLFSLILFFIILFVLSCVLFLSLSIGSWVALLLSIWILLLPSKWKKMSLLIILLSAVFISSLYFDKTRLIIDTIEKDIAARKLYWINGVNTLIERPFFGIGMNRIRQISYLGRKGTHAHNQLLHTAAELGISGLIAYLGILIGTGYMCLEVWRKSNIGWMRITVLGLGCGLLAHLIFGMGDSIPLGAKPGIFFWFSLGLIAAIYNYTVKTTYNS